MSQRMEKNKLGFLKRVECWTSYWLKLIILWSPSPNTSWGRLAKGIIFSRITFHLLKLDKELLAKIICFDDITKKQGSEKNVSFVIGRVLPITPPTFWIVTPSYCSSHPTTSPLGQSSLWLLPCNKHRPHYQQCHASCLALEQKTRKRRRQSRSGWILMVAKPAFPHNFTGGRSIDCQSIQEFNLPCTPPSSDAYPSTW